MLIDMCNIGNVTYVGLSANDANRPFCLTSQFNKVLDTLVGGRTSNGADHKYLVALT
jgi:hypothetical protein